MSKAKAQSSQGKLLKIMPSVASISHLTPEPWLFSTKLYLAFRGPSGGGVGPYPPGTHAFQTSRRQLQRRVHNSPHLAQGKI